MPETPVPGEEESLTRSPRPSEGSGARGGTTPSALALGWGRPRSCTLLAGHLGVVAVP